MKFLLAGAGGYGGHLMKYLNDNNYGLFADIKTTENWYQLSLKIKTFV